MSMTKGTRPIDASNLARRIREYMDDFPNATTRLATCRAILSMLGDEKQTPTLRPITREQVEKAWRGCSWCNNEGKKPENWECFILDNQGFSVVVGDEVVWTNAEFCPVCGKPLTDEAVDTIMKRMEEMRND